MSCPVEYWIWLQQTLGAGFFADELVSYFTDARGVYEAGEDAWIFSGTLSPKNFQKLSTLSPSQSYDIMNACEKNGWHIIPYDSPLYPKRLRRINSFPLVLYVWGDVNVLDTELSIGMVGTRNCSDYGLNIARSLSGELAGAGFTVVSGGAVGVDRACHEGAMDSNGKTIAFLGCGLGCEYLKFNENMRKRISESGAVVSEFPPFTPASRITFPIRNRLISGMSLGTVVIEAKEKSGSLITARYCREQGRTVFAVPGDVTNSNFFGTNKLIRDGAKAVFSAFDIINEFADMYPELASSLSPDEHIERIKTDASDSGKTPELRVNKKKEQSKQLTLNDFGVKEEENPKEKDLPEFLTTEAKKVYSYLGNEAVHSDIIAQKCGMDSKEVLCALTELELYGLCTVHPGGRYSK